MPVVRELILEGPLVLALHFLLAIATTTLIGALRENVLRGHGRLLTLLASLRHLLVQLACICRDSGWPALDDLLGELIAVLDLLVVIEVLLTHHIDEDLAVPVELPPPDELGGLLGGVQFAIAALRILEVGVEMDNDRALVSTAGEAKEDARVPALHAIIIFEDADDEELVIKLDIEHAILDVVPELLPRELSILMDEGFIVHEEVAPSMLDHEVVEQLQRVALLDLAILDVVLVLLLPEQRQPVHLLPFDEDGVAEDLIHGQRHAVIHGKWHLQSRGEEEVIHVPEDLAGVPERAIDASIERTLEMTLARVQVGDAINLRLHVNDASAPTSTSATLGSRSEVGLLLGGVLLAGLPLGRLFLGGLTPGGLLLGGL